mmetsp:Transcript_11565/g.14998  ORF Transcript_11565/g.14998 Transcript_11565/m.14998 type:complete len:701 (-) Transcript_11565:1144-3246(-)|eukprot:CAMPEP_0184009988 /NCGR_PEP_ID=MMETSP0954-20121128/2938_1 /TAXON_ID=627963 /ORGANISM="Aplanochytrium sp, Strain PBS07" /LENGTH=700 /DNA_ID=CAMNT_0026289477 /DNA_START=61 /DNA_END=2163 /DNA_ORIENTATION=-
MAYCKLATCSLDQWAMDFEGNLRRIKESIIEAKNKGARYRLGPELEISGYGCEDHFLEVDTFNHAAEVLAELLESGVMDGIICDIGIPILHKNVPYNCRAICLGSKIIYIRPKLYLADDNNYREPRWFARWVKKGHVENHRLLPVLAKAVGEETVPFGDCTLETKDTLVSPETCEELFTPNSPHIELGLSGVEIFTNGSGSHHELRKLHTRIDLIRSATSKVGGVYMYSNQLGCDGGRLNFDGCALIAVNGQVVAQGSQFSLSDVEVITAVVDLEAVRAYRIAQGSRSVQAAETVSSKSVFVPFTLTSEGPIAVVSKPIDVKYFSPEEEIAYGPAVWCWDYLRRSGGNGFLLPLSGGADSSSTAAIIGSMCQMVAKEALAGNKQVIEDARRICNQDETYVPSDPKEFANQIMHTVYMGTSNSSDGTKDFAKGLSSEIGTYHLYSNIDAMVSGILSVFKVVTGKTPKFKVYGGSYAENQALQNIQARLRMVFAYLLAQLLPWVRGKQGWLLVLGSANVDEGLRGYLTKYDCSSADLNPIGGICKADLKRFLYWAGESETLNYKILHEIVKAPPTAELEPITDEYVQKDEDDMGMTYEELTIYGRLRKISRCGPVSMLLNLLNEWSHMTAKQVSDKVKFFFRMYSINRHKMTVLTPSVHMVGYSPEDNRHDLRQIFYNVRWPWQFKKMDEIVKRFECGDKLD